MIIVLSGVAGAGKDAVSDILVEMHGFIAHGLADPLKRFAEDMFGFTKDQLYGPSRSRNAPDPRWARPCPECAGADNVDRSSAWSNAGQKEPCRTCEGTGKLNDNSARRVLVLLGTEYLRDMIHPDALTMRALQDLEPMSKVGTNVVVNQGRYQNDRDNLHNWLGAHRVDVRAPEKKSDGAAWRQHKSELDRPGDDQVEYVLTNPERWPFPGLPERVETMLNVLNGFLRA